jgi:hypothetical protein
MGAAPDFLWLDAGAILAAADCTDQRAAPISLQEDDSGVQWRQDEAMTFEAHPIGIVQSPLDRLESAPRQPDENAPEAWLVFDSTVREGLETLRVGDEVVVTDAGR